ncbi:MAG: AraC family transcriptional regulator [Bacteroidaceae bacterium]|nr:AraC family transcriptional regulator [Bacteroidaceae bacterium]
MAKRTNGMTDHRLDDAESQQTNIRGNYRAWGQFSIVPDSSCGSNGALALHQPYRLVEGRLMNVVGGHIRSTANLQEYELRAGDTLLLPPDCIIELLEMSDDTRLQILSYSDDAFAVKNHEVIQVSPQGDEHEQIALLVRLVWLALGQTPVMQSVVEHLFQSLQSLVVGISERETGRTLAEGDSRKRMLFQRFLKLVNIHCARERSLTFYADVLCLSPHYLSTMVKQVSGVNVTTWINRAVCLEAKVRLRHTHQLVSQISEELNFPNPAFFNKFFKRETGMTPGDYRER